MSETEHEDAVILANKILDRISADPDDDLAILSRQFLRSLEETAYWKTEAEEARRGSTELTVEDQQEGK